MTGVLTYLVDHTVFKDFCKKLQPGYEVRLTCGLRRVWLSWSFHRILRSWKRRCCLCRAQFTQNSTPTQEKILMIVTDNSSNMLKAIRMLREWDDTGDADAEIEEEIFSSDEHTVVHNDDELSMSAVMTTGWELYYHDPRLAHSSHLVLHCPNKLPAYNIIVSEARNILRSARSSSAITGKSRLHCRTVCPDCSTRWNGSNLMLNRSQDSRLGVTVVFKPVTWDYFEASQWQATDEVCTLLQPFREHTHRCCRQIQLHCQTSCQYFWIRSVIWNSARMFPVSRW